MKLIDNNGRLFGKISIIDVLVILVVAAMGAALYLKTNHNEITSTATSNDTITYQVLVSGVRTSRLLINKLAPLLLYGAFSVLVMILLVRDEPFVETEQMRALITIAVPDNYKLLLAVSAVVTMLFFASVVVFFRVLTRNCYAPVGMGLFVYLFFEAIN